MHTRGCVFLCFGCVMGSKWIELVSYIDKGSLYFTWHRETGILYGQNCLFLELFRKKTIRDS